MSTDMGTQGSAAGSPVIPDAGMLPAPDGGWAARMLADAVGFAVLAPSSHNTQPWSFHLRRDGLDIELDRSRVLPIADPAAREMIMSCAAALQNIKIALRHWGYAAKVEILPYASAPDVLARVRIGGPRTSSRLNDLLLAAIRERHTNRAPFQHTPVAPRLIAAMRAAAELEGAWLDQTTDATLRPIIAAFIAEGDRQQWVDPRFRRELAGWMRPNTGPIHDGLPGYLFGMPNIVARFAPPLLKTIPLGRMQARHDRALALDAPLLVVLKTKGDTPRDWMAAGQALQLVLLVAAAHGIAASFLNQPLQVAALRAELHARLGLSGFTQAILRMGYPTASSATPRRDISDVFDDRLHDDSASAEGGGEVPR
jgi:hypothetical protein